jgi:hypothetical protein
MKTNGLLISHIIYKLRASLGVWLRLFFKVFFTRKYIKIIFFIFKKLFLTSTHQKSKNTKKNINLKKKNKKNSNFFRNPFKIQKQTGSKKINTSQ